MKRKRHERISGGEYDWLLRIAMLFFLIALFLIPLAFAIANAEDGVEPDQRQFTLQIDILYDGLDADELARIVSAIASEHGDAQGFVLTIDGAGGSQHSTRLRDRIPSLEDLDVFYFTQ